MQDTRTPPTAEPRHSHRARIVSGWVVAFVATVLTLITALGAYDSATPRNPTQAPSESGS